MKNFKALIVFISLLSFYNVSHADGLSQSDLNQASSQAYSSADFMLNKAYQQLMGALEGKEKDSLKSAQKAWLTFRDLNTKFIADQYAGGSIAPMMKNQALTEMTNYRIAILTKMHLDVITP